MTTKQTTTAPATTALSALGTTVRADHALALDGVVFTLFGPNERGEFRLVQHGTTTHGAKLSGLDAVGYRYQVALRQLKAAKRYYEAHGRELLDIFETAEETGNYRQFVATTEAAYMEALDNWQAAKFEFEAEAAARGETVRTAKAVLVKLPVVTEKPKKALTKAQVARKEEQLRERALEEQRKRAALPVAPKYSRPATGVEIRRDVHPTPAVVAGDFKKSTRELTRQAQEVALTIAQMTSAMNEPTATPGYRTELRAAIKVEQQKLVELRAELGGRNRLGANPKRAKAADKPAKQTHSEAWVKLAKALYPTAESVEALPAGSKAAVTRALGAGKTPDTVKPVKPRKPATKRDAAAQSEWDKIAEKRYGVGTVLTKVQKAAVTREFNRTAAAAN